MFIALSKKRLLNKVKGPIRSSGFLGSRSNDRRISQPTIGIMNPITNIENRTINLLKNNQQIMKTEKPINIENDGYMRKNSLNNNESLFFSPNKIVKWREGPEYPLPIKAAENPSINQSSVLQNTIHHWGAPPQGAPQSDYTPTLNENKTLSKMNTNTFNKIENSSHNYQNQRASTNQFLQVQVNQPSSRKWNDNLMSQWNVNDSSTTLVSKNYLTNTHTFNPLESQTITSSDKRGASKQANVENTFPDSKFLSNHSTWKATPMNSVTNNLLSEKLLTHDEPERETFHVTEPQLQGKGMQKFVEIINQDNTKKQDIQINLSLPNVNNGSSFMDELQSIVSSMS